jgi:hypothetical protein
MQRSNRISTRHFVGDVQVIGETEEESQAGIDRLISSGGALPIDQISDLIIGPTVEARAYPIRVESGGIPKGL